MYRDIDRFLQLVAPENLLWPYGIQAGMHPMACIRARPWISFSKELRATSSLSASGRTGPGHGPGWKWSTAVKPKKFVSDTSGETPLDRSFTSIGKMKFQPSV